MSGKQKGWFCSSKGWNRCEFWRGHGLATLLSVSAWKSPTGGELLILSPKPSAGTLQPAVPRSAGALAPSLLPEHLKELKS